MIILDSTTKSVQIKLSASVATNQLPFSASYVDTNGSTTTPGEQDSITNNTTAVTVVSSPAASTERLIKNIIIQNADTASATVTVIYNNNSTLRNIIVMTLAAGDQMIYEDGNGWSVIDKNGNYKTVATPNGGVTSISNSDGTLTISPVTGNVVASVATNGVANANLAKMAGNTIKGNNTGSSANAADLTVSQTNALLFVAPTVQKFLSGSGTYTTPSNCLLLKVRMIGGGGGSSGTTTSGTDGGITIFGIWTAVGGSHGTNSSSAAGGIGGTGGTNGSGTVISRQSGQQGAGGNSGGYYSAYGGCSPFGGMGGYPGQLNNGAAYPALANTGSGAGGPIITGPYTYPAGGSGEYVEFYIPNPSSTYAYTIGAYGAAGTSQGAAGGSGVIIVEEFYH